MIGVKNILLNFVRNKIWFSIYLYFLGLLITLSLSQFEGLMILLGKSLMLFLPLHLIYRMIFITEFQLNEYKKSENLGELLPIIFYIAGMVFLLFCFFELVKYF